jgi:hypothetical protein
MFLCNSCRKKYEDGNAALFQVGGTEKICVYCAHVNGEAFAFNGFASSAEVSLRKQRDEIAVRVLCAVLSNPTLNNATVVNTVAGQIAASLRVANEFLLAADVEWKRARDNRTNAGQ